MEPILGIDLGTSYSSVAIVDEGTPIVIPDAAGRRTQASMVSFFPDGTILVGNEAAEQRIYNPENTIYSAKRFIGRQFQSREVQNFIRGNPSFKLEEGTDRSVVVRIFDRTYSLPQISALILSHMRKVAEEYIGDKVQKAVITVPANFSDSQRAATSHAGAMAGLDVLRILNEPTAAALAYGFGNLYDQKVAVYDFGGGTFDITVLDIKNDIFEVISTAGDTFLGGDDLDEALVQAVLATYSTKLDLKLSHDSLAVLKLRSEAEAAKRTLSDVERVTLRVPSIAFGPDGPVDVNVNLTRENFNKLITPVVVRSFKVCDDALEIAKLNKADIENVILVGGTTRIPLVREMVARYFGRKPFWGLNPDEVVAIGAAIQGSLLAEGSGSQALLLDVTPKSLSVATVGGRVERVIERNSPIPLEQTRFFTTSRDNQNEVQLRVYQGESAMETDNELIGSLTLKGLRPAIRGEVVIEVAFEIDTNGILQVRATNQETKQRSEVEINLLGRARPAGGLPGAGNEPAASG